MIGTVKERTGWQLAGHQVTQTMYYDAQQAKRENRRAFLVTAGELPDADISAGFCANCNGFGTLALEVVHGGPFRDFPHAGVDHGKDGDGPALRPAWHNGWFLVLRTIYPCPLCNAQEVKL